MGSSAKHTLPSAPHSSAQGSASTGADDAAAEAEFRAAMRFIRKGPSASLQYVVDEKRAELYALEAQAVHGPCSEASANPPVLEDPSSRRRREAWVALGQMPAAEAKRQLAALLSLLIPDWHDWEPSNMGEGGGYGREGAENMSRERHDALDAGAEEGKGTLNFNIARSALQRSLGHSGAYGRSEGSLAEPQQQQRRRHQQQHQEQQQKHQEQQQQQQHHHHQKQQQQQQQQHRPPEHHPHENRLNEHPPPLHNPHVHDRPYAHPSQKPAEQRGEWLQRHGLPQVPAEVRECQLRQGGGAGPRVDWLSTAAAEELTGFAARGMGTAGILGRVGVMEDSTRDGEEGRKKGDRGKEMEGWEVGEGVEGREGGEGGEGGEGEEGRGGGEGEEGREGGEGEEVGEGGEGGSDADGTAASGANGEGDMRDEGSVPRKRLRLTKVQSLQLEEKFALVSSPNAAEKAAFARELQLQPRQVEVWFQNRRARHRLRQAEDDCEQLRRRCEQLERENEHMQQLLVQSSEPAGLSASGAAATSRAGAPFVSPHLSDSRREGIRERSDHDTPRAMDMHRDLRVPRDLVRTERATGDNSRLSDSITLCPSCLSQPLGNHAVFNSSGVRPEEHADPGSNQVETGVQLENLTPGSGHGFDLNLTL
ncbi:unnamed protein product [Closterium sp. NIES-53]